MWTGVDLVQICRSSTTSWATPGCSDSRKLPSSAAWLPRCAADGCCFSSD